MTKNIPDKLAFAANSLEKKARRAVEALEEAGQRIAEEMRTSRVVPRATISSAARRRIIEEVAYFRALRRNFQNGSPTQDWLEAEADVELIITRLQEPPRHP